MGERKGALGTTESVYWERMGYSPLQYDMQVSFLRNGSQCIFYIYVGGKNCKTKLTQMIKYIDYLAARKMSLKYAQGNRKITL